MDELESAVMLCMNPPADRQLHARALQYCQNLRQSHQGFVSVLQRLTPSMRPEVAFWCLQVVQETVSEPTRYPGPLSSEQVFGVRAKILEMFAYAVHPQGNQNGGNLSGGREELPIYLLNKITQVVISLIAADYPHMWAGAFRETLLAMVRSPQRTVGAISMFFRTLRTLDEDVTSVRATQVSEASRMTATRVKDAMRDDCISEIVAICAELIASPVYVSQSFDILGRYVEWVDIGLFVQDRILTPMYRAVNAISLCDDRSAAAAALRAIVTKRMDAASKINLLNALRIEELLQAIPVVQICANEEEFGDSELSLQSGRVEVAALVNTIAIVALDILKDGLKDKLQVENSTQVFIRAGVIAQVALPVALRFLDENSDEETSSQTLQSVTTYVNVFSRLTQTKKNGAQSESAAAMAAILKVVEERALFPKDFDPQDDKSDEQKAFLDIRRVLVKSIFRSVVRAFPDMCLDFVKGLLTKAAESNDVSRTELALSMLIALMTVNSEAPEVLDLRKAVIASPPTCMEFNTDLSLQPTSDIGRAQQHQLELVSKTYFDLVARSYRVFLSHPDPTFLASVLAVFFDRRGLGHASSQVVRSHAAYSLLKLTRPLRSIIINTDLDGILRAIRQYMFPLVTDVGSQGGKDQMVIFETVGYLLGTDHRKDGSLQYLAAILRPITDGLHSNVGPLAVPFILAAGFLSKGFGGDSKPLLLPLNGNDEKKSPDVDARVSASNADTQLKDVKVQRLTPLAGDMQETWIDCLNAVLKASMPCLEASKDSTLLEVRSKLLFFLHRMVDTIGVPVLPFLEGIIPRLLVTSDSAVELRDTTILASQAITKFGQTSKRLAALVLNPIVQNSGRYSYSLSPASLQAISEEDRETVEMHRAYTYFLHAIVGSELVKLLISPDHSALTKEIMETIVSSAVGKTLDLRVAASVMKMSLHMIRQLVARWTGKDATPDSPAEFSDYVLARIPDVTVRCCIEGTIFRAGEYDSGQAVAVLIEDVQLQRTCALKLGEAFGQALQAGPFASLSKEDVLAYLTALYAADTPTPALVTALAALSKMLRSR